MSSSGRYAEFGPFRLFPGERRLVRKDQDIVLGSRAFDILLILLEKAGTIVSKQELLSRVWPGISVEESSLRVHIAGVRKALKGEGSGSSYVVNSAGRGYSFAGRATWHDAIADSPPARPVSPQRLTGLPRRPTRMLGRDGDVVEISRALALHRFVTIHGPGGIGKTTVALAIAHNHLGAFADGILFLDFGLRSSHDNLRHIVASSLGLMAESADPTGSITEYLRHRRLLLVFDCCEHLIDAAASLAETIVHEAPQVSIIATSREILRAEGEHVYALSSLATPPPDLPMSIERLFDYPATQLFLERVVAGGHRGNVSDREAEAVADICRKVDGVALALELVAGRISTHGFQGTATLLDTRLKLLWQGRRTALPRHQTLHATLDWSYTLITERERTVLRRLSAFVGPFILDAAQAVAADHTLDATEVAAGLAQLVSKSLVAADTSEETTKYRLLDITRAYARSKLLLAGEVDGVGHKHASYYAELLRHFVVHNHRIGEYGPEHLANIRAGLEWCFSPAGDPELAVKLTNAATRIFREFSLLSESLQWCERALAILDVSMRDTFWEMNLHSSLAYCVMFTAGNSERARTALDEGLRICRSIGDPYFQFRLLSNLHMYHRRRGELGRLLDIARQAEALAPELGEPTAIVAANVMLGVSHHLVGDQAAARSAFLASRELRPDSYRFSTNYLGFHQDGNVVLARTLWLQGFPDQALTLVQEAEAEERRDPVTACLTLIWATTVLLWTGDWGKAETYIESLLQVAGENSLRPYKTLGIGFKGDLLVRRGEISGGLRLLRESLAGLRSDRYELFSPWLSGAVAEGLAALGQLDLALAQLEEVAISLGNECDVYRPELLRIRGEVLMQAGNERAAEQAFRQSMALADDNAALSWRLRSATSLARLLDRQSRRDEARAMLASTYARFHEGFSTLDLKAAKSLLATFDATLPG
jgi:predicted ATPase/DNA-binding winged helix-turn-helix (wHTH) protein